MFELAQDPVCLVYHHMIGWKEEKGQRGFFRRGEIIASGFLPHNYLRNY